MTSDTTVITPARSNVADFVREVWQARQLIAFLAWRDLRVRYAQTLLGVGWAILQPATMMIIFSLVFGQFIGLPSEDVPYPLFVLCGLLPWQLFAQTVNGAANSLTGSAGLVSKVYFPRLALPLAAGGAPLVDFAIGLIFLAAVSLLSWSSLSAQILAAPLSLIIAMVAAQGVGMLLAALYVRYRDVRHIVPFMLQAWLWATPVVYSLTVVPEWLQPAFALNPMTGAVELFRWAFLGLPDAPVLTAGVGAVMALVLLVIGIAYFRRTEQTFADVI